MGISAKFIKYRATCHFIAAIFVIGIPVFALAQNNTNDVPVKLNGKKFYRHIVTKGETVYGLAEKYNEPPKEIIFQNPTAIDGIHPGDTLMIPVVAKTAAIDTTSAQGDYIYHDVVGKETLYSLAKRYNTTVGAIDSLNPEITEKGLQVGQRLRIPSPSAGNRKAPQKHIASNDGVAQQNTGNTRQKETRAFKALVGTTPADTSKSVATGNYKDTGKRLKWYNIGLIMPFGSENADTIHLGRLLNGTSQIPLITQISVDFYHGILLAFDSLAIKGFRVNLHVFNISSASDSSSYSIDSVLKNPEILKMNLLIGPAYPSNFRRIARFAGIHRIPIVSPLSSESNVLKNNPWTSKVIPSVQTETEVQADYIATHCNTDNIILIHNRDANSQYYEVFKKRFHQTDSALGRKDSLHTAESIGGVNGLANIISNNRPNVIVMPYEGAPFVAKFVNELANSRYMHNDSVVLFGMQSWTKNDALSPDNLDTVNLHFPSNDFVNYSDAPTKKFIMTYRNEYLSEPSYYSYEGYDAAMFYGSLLFTYGTDVQGHLGDLPYAGIQTSFKMLRNNPSTGYDNKAVYILEYRSYIENLVAK